MFPIKDNKITPAQVKVSASKSYTLRELRDLMDQWIREQEGDTEILRWTMSVLIEWLGKKEREANG